MIVYGNGRSFTAKKNSTMLSYEEYLNEQARQPFNSIPYRVKLIIEDFIAKKNKVTFDEIVQFLMQDKRFKLINNHGLPTGEDVTSLAQSAIEQLVTDGKLVIGQNPNSYKVKHPSAAKAIKALNLSMKKNIEAVAQSYFDADYDCEVDEMIPTVAAMNKLRTIFFAQGEEAEEILQNCPPNVNIKDYVMFMLDSAGVLPVRI